MLGKKLGGGPADHSTRLGVVSGAIFLGSSRVDPTLLMACERLPRTWTTHRKRMQGHMCIGVGSVCVVCIGFSPVGCASIRITATLEYE
jgi:hypothetical protein